jgi:CRISPR-associated protein Cas2
MRRSKKARDPDPPPVSPYRFMWVLVMFDLPVLTKEDRKNYREFRKQLLKRGYLQLQFSVYARPCHSDENAQVHKERVLKYLPPEGEVRIAMFTDKQFQRMELFFGKRASEVEKQPEQLSFF